MKLVVLLAAAVLVLPAPSLGWAQPQPQAAAQPTAKAIALSKRYVELMDMPKLLDSMMTSMVPQMLASIPEAKSLPPGAAEAMTSATRESVNDIMPKMLDRVATEYAKVFTEDELQALVDFYGGPYGKSIVEKLPKATPAMTAAMVDLIPEMQSDMAKHFCAKMGCGAQAKAPNTSA